MSVENDRIRLLIASLDQKMEVTREAVEAQDIIIHRMKNSERYLVEVMTLMAENLGDRVTALEERFEAAQGRR